MDDWTQLEEQCAHCRACPLCETRTHVVPGMGVRDADVMFVGEAPGENEDLQGMPFVGRAGQLLDDILSLVDLYRDRNFYITNILKCRPPRNRTPLPQEQDACIGFLNRQIRLVQPKIMVCLGRIAAQRLIRDDFSITREHGAWVRTPDGIWRTAIYHPSALLRNPNYRPDTFADLRALRSHIREVCPRTYQF